MVWSGKTAFLWSLSVITFALSTASRDVSDLLLEQNSESDSLKTTTSLTKDGIINLPGKLQRNTNVCTTNTDCQNGGECLKDRDGDRFCRCKDGISGVLCEVVDDCVKDPPLCGTGLDAQCVYDLVNERANCSCNDENKDFDSYVKKCRVPCISDIDCVNATCTKNEDGDLKFCRCPWGFRGDTCTDSVDECKESGRDCGNHPNVSCVEEYDGKAICHCSGWNVAFDYDDKICRDCDCGEFSIGCDFIHGGAKKCYCYRNNYLTDEGKCEPCECGYGSNSCHSENGTKVCDCYGFTANNNGTCEDCICGEGSTHCYFEKGEKICGCRPGYIQDHDACKRKCTDPGVVCFHGSKCVNDVCQCLPTTHGEVCEVMDWCKNIWDQYHNCGKQDNVYCYFNETSLESFCHCKEANHFYDPEQGSCRACDCGENRCAVENGKQVCICEAGYISVNGTCRKKCSANDVCRHGGKCVGDVCQCLSGTRGDLCDLIIGCETKSDSELKCGSIENAHCEFNEVSLETFCKCENEDLRFDPHEKICKKCTCGPNGDCSFDVSGGKICHCKTGFEEKGGFCGGCDCGPFGVCNFNKDGDPVCSCIEGYQNNNGSCEYCTCLAGSKTVTCYFDKGSPTCVCPEGYVASLYFCDDIDECLNASACPENTTCRNTDGNYTCRCPYGYRPFSDQHDTKIYGCTDIDECVEEKACPHRDTTDCVNTPGSYHCRCKKGYHSKFSEFIIRQHGCDIEQEELKIGITILNVVVLSIIIGLSVVIGLKRTLRFQGPNTIIQLEAQ